MRGTGASRGEKFPIGTLAKTERRRIETIRDDERAGLLKHPPRSPGGRREYRWIFAGWCSSGVRASSDSLWTRSARCLRAVARRTATCADVRAIAVRHLAEIRAKLRDLARLESILTATVAQRSGQDAPECAVLSWPPVFSDPLRMKHTPPSS